MLRLQSNHDPVTWRINSHALVTVAVARIGNALSNGTLRFEWPNNQKIFASESAK
jgi:hypothetical protein